MIDPGAEVTLIRRDVAEKLELAARPSPWAIESWRGDGPAFQALAVDLTISNSEENFQLQVENAQVVPMINASGRMINWELMRSDWPHLDGLDMPVVKPGEVGVLIGQDVDDAMEIIMTRRSTRPLAPIAKLTRFGWTVVGRISNRYERRQAGDRHQKVRLVRKISNATLKETMEKFGAMESYGVIQRLR